MMNLSGMKVSGMNCPVCDKYESKGLVPLFQKDGRIIYEPGECERCENNLLSEWLEDENTE